MDCTATFTPKVVCKEPPLAQEGVFAPGAYFPGVIPHLPGVNTPFFRKQSRRGYFAPGVYFPGVIPHFSGVNTPFSPETVNKAWFPWVERITKRGASVTGRAR